MTYAGLERGDFNLISFTRSQLDEILAKLKIDIVEQELYIRGDLVTCKSCGTRITKRNLGNILPGSKHIFCDDPSCFADYVSEHTYSAPE